MEILKYRKYGNGMTLEELGNLLMSEEEINNQIKEFQK